MGKAVLISIQPGWVEQIMNGEKTLEVRKTKPKLEPPFKCYIYCTKGADAADRLWVLHEKIRQDYYGLVAVCANLGKQPENHSLGNGKVVAEFTCDQIVPIVPAMEPYGTYDVDDDFVAQTCLVNGALWDYGKCATLYSWHISNLGIYDTPKELNEFWFPPELYCEKERCGGCPYDQVADVNGEYSFDCEWKRPLTRPPQSWCYVEELKNG